MSRPDLTPWLDPGQFRQFRWLKAELIDFCQDHGLPTDGSKHQLKRRVKAFLLQQQGAPNRSR